MKIGQVFAIHDLPITIYHLPPLTHHSSLPTFRYTAVDRSLSRTLSGVLTADTPRAARDQLREQQLVITDLREVRAESKAAKWLQPLGRLGLRARAQQVTDVTRLLAILLHAGVPLSDAISTLARQAGRRLGGALHHTWEAINGGASLAQALERYPRYFDPVYVNVVRVGEASGRLEEVLARLADHRQRAADTRSQIASALAYPTILCLVGAGVVTFLLNYVVPKIIKILTEAGRPLPASTRMLLSVSDAMGRYWPVALLATAASVAGTVLAMRHLTIRRVVHRAWLRLPLIGELAKKDLIARFSQMMATLLENDVPLPRALEIGEATIRNQVLVDALADLRRAIIAGQTIAAPLQRARLFPPVMIHMLSVGEQSGQLSEMFGQVHEMFRREVTIFAARFTKLLEPMLIVILGVVVGFIIYATLMPILEVGHVL